MINKITKTDTSALLSNGKSEIYFCEETRNNVLCSCLQCNWDLWKLWGSIFGRAEIMENWLWLGGWIRYSAEWNRNRMDEESLLHLRLTFRYENCTWKLSRHTKCCSSPTKRDASSEIVNRFDCHDILYCRLSWAPPCILHASMHFCVHEKKCQYLTLQ